MSVVLRIFYPLAVIVVPAALCWMYLEQAPALAFVTAVAFWILTMLLRDFSASVLRGRELACSHYTIDGQGESSFLKKSRRSGKRSWPSGKGTARMREGGEYNKVGI